MNVALVEIFDGWKGLYSPLPREVRVVEDIECEVVEDSLIEITIEQYEDIIDKIVDAYEGQEYHKFEDEEVYLDHKVQITICGVVDYYSLASRTTTYGGYDELWETVLSKISAGGLEIKTYEMEDGKEIPNDYSYERLKAYNHYFK